MGKSIETLALEYAEIIRKSEKKYDKVGEIVKSISELQYEENGRKISSEDKRKLLKQLQIELTTPKMSNGMRMIKESENTAYIELVRHIEQQLLGGQK